jgi:hypothetical protein
MTTDQPTTDTYALVLGFTEPADDFEGVLCHAAAIIRDRLQTSDVAAMRILSEVAADASRLLASAPTPRHQIPRRVRESVLVRMPACVECGATSDLQIDHIIPHSKGGPDREWNLQTLCGGCNRAKGAG